VGQWITSHDPVTHSNLATRLAHDP